MSNFLNMKNNLIQNFYIIGVTQEDINSNLKDILSNNFNKRILNLNKVYKLNNKICQIS